ncbi:hypothetical protein FDP41_004894 [Naegleria fowleri]|uniref:Uncharacterized protein n=1 Tax=Naegleria fowleri TaxID=5763 RepID=A0A6A5BTH7_NAEFO|nr:uncharacterized protein FDP41_004894 [Naegleria fowleri]KAF0976219.1 hypothetical protein FDP41_004894 [Naegleria fowleri]
MSTSPSHDPLSPSSTNEPLITAKQRPFVNLLMKIQEDISARSYSQIESYTQAILELEQKPIHHHENNDQDNNTLKAFNSIKEIGKLWLALGELQFGSETMDEQALSSIEKSLSYDITRSRAHFFKGVISSFLGRFEDALQGFEQAILLEPDKATYWFEKGRCVLTMATTNRDSNTTSRLVEGLECYKKVKSLSREQALQYDLTSSLFNLGMKFTFEKDLEHALESFQEAVELQPDDLQIHGKIVQLYETLNQKDKRDEKVKEIYAMYKRKEFPNDMTRFCRDQFDINSSPEAEGKNIHVFVYEHFELVGNNAVKFVFQCTDEAQKQVLLRISLGSYEMTNSLMKELRGLADNQRVYHLDGYYHGNLHKTFGFYDGTDDGPAMSYDDLKQKVVGILDGSNATVMSSSTGPNRFI